MQIWPVRSLKGVGGLKLTVYARFGWARPIGSTELWDRKKGSSKMESVWHVKNGVGPPGAGTISKPFHPWQWWHVWLKLPAKPGTMIFRANKIRIPWALGM